MELAFHDGTVRDIVFMQDSINRTSLLISGGAGDNKIYVTDCESGMPVRAMAGHSGKSCKGHRIIYWFHVNCRNNIYVYFRMAQCKNVTFNAKKY